MKKTLFIAVMASLLAVASPSQAADAAAGQGKAASCGGCHGADGNSMSPMNPNLAGQKEMYLVSATKAYKTGDRKHPTMQAMVMSLSDQDIADISAFYAAQKAK